ncbi:MAG: hypothetical protein KY459_15620 [Acidobacteria bacterium]|nr:hypothetical protein [Acidobacteriota bacterium]
MKRGYLRGASFFTLHSSLFTLLSLFTLHSSLFFHSSLFTLHSSTAPRSLRPGSGSG